MAWCLFSIAFLTSCLVLIVFSIHESAATFQGKQVAVSCIGDSITVAGGPQDDYPAQLAQILGNGYNVTNRGVSGHTMMNSGLCAASPAGNFVFFCVTREINTVFFFFLVFYQFFIVLL